MEIKGAYESNRFLWNQKWQKILTATFFPGDHVKSLGESITPRGLPIVFVVPGYDLGVYSCKNSYFDKNLMV